MFYYATLLNKPAASNMLIKGNGTYAKPLCESCFITHGHQDVSLAAYVVQGILTTRAVCVDHLRETDTVIVDFANPEG